MKNETIPNYLGMQREQLLYAYRQLVGRCAVLVAIIEPNQEDAPTMRRKAKLRQLEERLVVVEKCLLSRLGF